MLWHTIIPIDYDKPWDMRGLKFLAKIIKRNYKLCKKFLSSPKFKEFITLKKIDLVIVDYFLNVIFCFFFK